MLVVGDLPKISTPRYGTPNQFAYFLAIKIKPKIVKIPEGAPDLILAQFSVWGRYSADSSDVTTPSKAPPWGKRQGRY